MKGIIFNLLEEVVVDAHGERVWDTLLDEAGVSGVYTSLGSYDDAEIMSLVSAAGAGLSASMSNPLGLLALAARPAARAATLSGPVQRGLIQSQPSALLGLLANDRVTRAGLLSAPILATDR